MRKNTIDVDNEEEYNTDDDQGILNLSHQLNCMKRRKMGDQHGHDGGYINSDFILGSVADIERILSVAKHILSDERKQMDPKGFESLMFLKTNRRFWNVNLICEALSKVPKHDEEQNG